MTASAPDLKLSLRRIVRVASWLSLALAVFGCPFHRSVVLAHPPLASVTEPAAEDDEDQPRELPAGLTAEYKGADGRTIARIDPAVSYSWNEAPAEPRL